MRISKTLIALAAGLSLMTVPTIAAAQDDGEHGGSNTVLLALGIAGVAGFLYAVIKDNNDDDVPVSP